MISVRRSAERGRFDIDWLQSRHTFSFGHYLDPNHMGFGALRVINEDRVAPGAGFPPHGHADMEIVSYVLDGALEHRDSLGTGSVIRPGDVQRMSAGTGIRHAEYNASDSAPVHFLQIWIQPGTRGVTPGYEQKAFGDALKGAFRLVASPDGRDGSLTIHQDAALYAARLAAGETAALTLGDGRRAWLQVARGSVTANGARLDAGDGAGLTGVADIAVAAETDAEVLLFDLA
ncbi:pirin family protein [Futiania mangrovi]|uniref:Pirin family protein n=1 Tax=Futiania mangrovi TaxID=2959716 RepID=A0A9J6PEI6_9PROT|nr:pirin family protein [Futiania mangrovii]MCP1336179.1 pirin family protein [Futiania mangrovii]